MIVEVAATRVLSPFYGNTIFTVSSVISIILAALSIGYYVGGRAADKYPSLRLFFGIIMASGVLSLALNLAGKFILPVLSSLLSISAGPLVSSLLLFFTPALLLGMLSPYAVKLQSLSSPAQGVGSVAGKIFFWSTLGSILGSLLAGFALIPRFGVDQIIIANGIVLFFLGFIPLVALGQKKHLLKFFLTAVAFLAVSLYVLQAAEGDVIYAKDGVYEKITIYNGRYLGRPARFFQQDRSSSGAMFLDTDNPEDLAYEYTRYYSLYKIFNPAVKNALVIGGGAYSIPKALLSELPDTSVDVAEIEPTLFDLAKTYFKTGDNPNLHNYTEDGRRLLADSKKNYDLIFSDVYYSLFSIPAHFTTEEFFKIAKSKLNNDGIFIASIVGNLSRQEPSFTMSEIKTFKNVFPNSYFFAVGSPEKTQSQNIVLVGYNSGKTIDLNSKEITDDPNPVIRSLRDKTIDMKRFELSSYPTLTDDYSPVEYMTGKVLQKTFDQNDILDGKEMLAVINQQLSYGPRYPTADGHQRTKDFLIAELNSMTPEVKTQTWRHTDADGKSYELTNIIGRLYPDKTKRIILATHYDSQKISFKNTSDQNQPSPGANNSASGTAVLIELARSFENSATKPGAGIDIVFFDGEEGDESQGGDFKNWKPIGSTYFAQNLEELYKNDKPVLAIVLDMVCDKDLKINQELSSVNNAPAQTKTFWKIAEKIDGSVFKNQILQEIRDDHTPLNAAGIPSTLVIDFDYPYYATTRDTIDKCSADSLEIVAKAVWNYVYTGID